MRRLAVLVLLLAAALVFPTVGSGASPGPPSAHAAKKLKRCKPGANAKKCRCPKGQKLVKKGHKYRCKKKAAPQQGQPDGNQGTNNNTGTGTNTDPGTGTGTNTDPGTGTGTGAQTEHDDAGYTAAL